MKKLFCQLLKNLKISYQEEQNNIKYEEYYFNGIQIPKDIEIKEITSKSFKIFWKIDNLNIINVDNKKIKFRIEIKEENSNEFIQIYEGNNLEFLVNNLNKNSKYEIKICIIYNDLVGPWSEIYTVKTSNKYCDSIILDEYKRKDEFLDKIFEWTGLNEMQLIYRGSRDGTTSLCFHNKCDNKGPTICLYKNEKGNIFGG